MGFVSGGDLVVKGSGGGKKKIPPVKLQVRVLFKKITAAKSNEELNFEFEEELPTYDSHRAERVKNTFCTV